MYWKDSEVWRARVCIAASLRRHTTDGLRDYGIEPQVWGGEPGCEHSFGGERLTEAGRNDGGRDIGGRKGNYQGNGPHKSEVSTGAFCRHCNAWRGSLGLEPTLDLYLDHMVITVFREIRRVLRKDGTCWLNIGDSYASGKQGNDSFGDPSSGLNNGRAGVGNKTGEKMRSASRKPPPGFKSKDLMLIPSRLAIRLCDDGWWVRSDIAWCKKAPMPESCTDRPTTAWEHVFLLTRSAKYFYDQEAVKEESEYPDDDRKSRSADGQKRLPTEKIAGVRPGSATYPKRNLRNFWLLGPEPFSDWIPDFEHADYVDDRGNPRKVSPGCPIHGQAAQPRPGTHEAASCDEQPTDPLIGNRHTGNDRALALDHAAASTMSCRASSQQDNRSVSHSENSLASRISADHLEDSPRTSGRSRRTLDGQAASTNGSLDLGDLQKPSGRNTVESKTDHLQSASPHDKASVETLSHISSKSNKSLSHAKCVCPISQTSHFASYPTEIPRICIKAGTSERGVCPKCAAPWGRMVAREAQLQGSSPRGKHAALDADGTHHGQNSRRGESGSSFNNNPALRPPVPETIGWRPTCACDAGAAIPATVCDPFLGAGTTAMVADQLGRNCIGIELSESYARMAENRIRNDAGMFAEIAAE